MTNTLVPIAAIAAQSTGWPARAKSLEIIDTETLVVAGDELKAVKSLQAACDESFNPIIEKAHAAHKEALKQKKAVREPLEQAELVFKSNIARFQTNQELQRRAEQRRLEEAARVAQEQELEAEIEQAEAQGATVAEVEAIIERPTVQPIVFAPPPAPKLAGVTMRDNWTGQITDMWAFIQYCVKENRKDLLGLIQADSGAVNSLARSLKSALNVPGLDVRNVPIVAAGRK